MGNPLEKRCLEIPKKRCKMNGTGRRWCPTVRFGISGAEPSGPTTGSYLLFHK